MSDNVGSKMVKGAAIIGLAGVLVKILGAFFRIPVINWIGDIGSAYYSVAYNIYAILVVLATAGLPVAISKLVSENIAKKRYRNAHKVFQVSFVLMVVLGSVLFMVCYFGATLLTKTLGQPNAAIAVRAIAPALFFVPLLASFRGYFQGRQNMNPTAISEVSEQFVRVIVGLILTSQFLSFGMAKAAAGATFGASAGSAIGLLIVVTIYILNRRAIVYKIETYDSTTESTLSIIKKISIVAVPIIIGAEVMPAMNFIDTWIITNRLLATGWAPEEATALYGMISGKCSTLIGFPQIFTQAVAISLVPAIARAYAMGNKKSVQENSILGYRLTMVIAFPCAIGIMAIPSQILLFMYPSDPDSAMNAAPTLAIMAVGIIFLANVQTSTGILQARGKQIIPVITLFIGAVIKLILSYILVGIPSLNIKGAAIATIVAYIIAMVLNNIKVKKYTNIQFEYIQTYVKPIIASAIMGVCAYATHYGIGRFVGNSIGTILSILVGMIVYAVLIILFRAVRAEELALMPGGRRLNSYISKVIRW